MTKVNYFSVITEKGKGVEYGESKNEVSSRVPNIGIVMFEKLSEAKAQFSEEKLKAARERYRKKFPVSQIKKPKTKKSEKVTAKK